MEVKVASTSLQWPQPIIPRSPPSHKPPFSISSFSIMTTRTRKDRALAHRFVQGSSLFGSPKSRNHTLKRACVARLFEFSHEEFSKQIEELAQKFDPSNDNNDDSYNVLETFQSFKYERGEKSSNLAFTAPFSPSKLDFAEPTSLPEPPDWPGRDEVIQASIERKANSVDIPISLRIIKRKQKWEEGFREAKEYTYCSVKAAFSSTVFIILELQSYTLQIREILFCEDLHEIISRVQREMHASFVWLFQQVFSRTPTLMVYVMILLANFTVYSIADSTAIAATPSPIISNANTVETVLMTERENQEQAKFDSSAVETFSVSSSIGGNGGGGGGGKVQPVASGTEGGDRHDLGRSTLSIQYPDVCSFGKDELTKEEEVSLWDSVMEEASRMQAELRGEVLDRETMQQFVSPVSVELEDDDYLEYFRTELIYQMGLSQDPSSSLLLCNYAQFLCIVTHEYDRAEECFKRGVELEPPDAEVLSQYANFLWLVRKDLWSAEERYQQAMAVEPNNPYHASKYATFLWNTGGEDTCFPLNTSDNNSKA